jgi:hypothetical protein
MPSVPISSVAYDLNFGSCRTVISAASSTNGYYTAMRYRCGFPFVQARARIVA